MFEKQAAILKAYGESMVIMVKAKIAPLSVTHQTENSVNYKSTLTRLGIYGRKFIEIIETGRGARKSPEYGSFDRSLEKYLDGKGFPTKVSKSGIKYYKIGNSWSSSKSLAYKINKEGDQTFKKGGRNVYSEELAVMAENLKKDIIANAAKEVVISLANTFKNGTVSS